MSAPLTYLFTDLESSTELWADGKAVTMELAVVEAFAAKSVVERYDILCLVRRRKWPAPHRPLW